MLERQVVIPASPEQLWTALTDPAELQSWFGAEVQWELRPGGGARFQEADGSVRRGQVEKVLPWRQLSFRWWPEDEGDGGTSRVTYTLEPEDDGTRLTVTEQPLTAVPIGLSAPVAVVGGAGSWTRWDSRLFGCWARAALAMAQGAGR